MSVAALCVGHASYDISTLVADFPVEDSKCEVQTLLEAGGGPAANAAYLLARWRVPTALAALVGDDRYGRQIVRELEQAGVDASRVEVRADHVTPVSIIVVNTKSGSRTIINRKAPQQELAPSPERFVGLRPRAMLFDGHEPEASLAALAELPGARTVLDAGSLRPGTAALAGKVEFLVASERFARQVTGEADLSAPEAQRRCVVDLRRRYGNTVVVTLGRRGLVMDDGEGFRAMPAFPAVAVDTTGAGDIFHGAFVFGLLEGMGLWDTLRLSSMAAAISVGREGARLSTPTLAEVREALANAG